jgi:type III pantothenate kinase
VLLVIDSGNTNIVFAVFNNNGELSGQWRASSDYNRTADELEIWLSQFMARDKLERRDITGAIIATVVPSNLFNLQDLCRRFFNCEPIIVGEPMVKMGLKILINNPKEVGADRLCNAVSAHQNYKGQVTVIDFGTATSFDVVDADGNYCGGIISPGVNLSLEALHMGTAQLPRVNIERPQHVIGTGTISAMQSGIFWGYVSMVEGITMRIKQEIGGEMTVIATGGLASMFADVTDAIDHWDKDLTLFGLLAIFRLNQP